MLRGALLTRRAHRRLCTEQIPGLRRHSFAKVLPRPDKPLPQPKQAHQGAIVRISTVSIRPSSGEELVSLYREKITELYDGMVGFQGAHLLLNREANKAQSVTLWRSQRDFDEAVLHPGYGKTMQELATHFLGSPELEVWEHAAAVYPGDQPQPP
ncbi:MAG: hypothetical protein SGPRY_004319 [Prymnesium sp.]